MGKNITQKVLPHRPRGRIPSMAGQNRREKAWIPKRSLEFRKAPVPDPLAENRTLVGPDQPKNFPTRTDERTAASLCPAMDGMRPLGLGQFLPAGRDYMGSWEIDQNHPLEWEKSQ